MSDLDAIYFCHTHPLATYKSLEAFKKYHPTSKVYLISDNGYNYTEMAKHFDCEYIFSNENINTNFTYYKQSKISAYDTISLFTKYCSMYEHVFTKSDKKYIIKLEDDVLVQGVIDTSTFKSAIIGRVNTPYQVRIPKTFIDTWYTYHTTYPKPEVMHYTGHGGSIFNREEFLICLGNTKIVEQVINVYISTNILGGYLIDDILFSMFCIVNGYTLQDNPTQMEVNSEKNTNKNPEDYIILHEVKENYNKPLPDELKHLVAYT